MTRRAWIASLSSIPLVARGQPAPQIRLPGKIRAGIVGLSGHVEEILDARRELPDLEVWALSDPDAALLREVGDRAGVPASRRYTDHRTLLDRERIAVAGVCGTDGEREELILACIARGIHVVAEKPLAMNWAGVARIREALASGKSHLTMLLPMRLYGSFSTMRQVVASGGIGEVAQFDAQKSYILGDRPAWMLNRSSFSGTIPYIGIHLADLMRFTTLREPVAVSAFQGHVAQPEAGAMENTAVAIFRFDNGAAGQMHLDYLRPAMAPSHGDDRLRIAGSRGVLEYREADGLTLVTNDRKLHKIDALPADRSLVANFLANVYASAPLELTLQDIFRANEIVFAARDAATQNRIVAIPPASA